MAKSNLIRKKPGAYAGKALMEAGLRIGGGISAKLINAKLFKNEKMPAFINKNGNGLTLALGLAAEIMLDNEFVTPFAQGMQIVAGTDFAVSMIDSKLGISGVNDDYSESVDEIVNRAMAGIGDIDNSDPLSVLELQSMQHSDPYDTSAMAFAAGGGSSKFNPGTSEGQGGSQGGAIQGIDDEPQI